MIPGHLGDDIVISVIQPQDLAGVGSGFVYAHQDHTLTLTASVRID
ncbi:MAG: hypothetical protein ACRCYQ_03130 [Nocardioides sp.]